MRDDEPGSPGGRAARAVAAIRAQRVLGIIRADSAEAARGLTVDLWQAGLRAVEISVSTPGAIEAVRALAGERADPAFVIGAGTVMNAATARAAVEAGADLLVSPIADPAVIAVGRDAGLAVLAGAATPGEAAAAMRAGASLVKLFPARLFTPAVVADILQALPDLPLVPVGGIAIGDVAGWLRAGAVAVGLGTSLTSGRPEDRHVRVSEVLGIASGAAADCSQAFRTQAPSRRPRPPCATKTGPRKVPGPPSDRARLRGRAQAPAPRWLPAPPAPHGLSFPGRRGRRWPCHPARATRWQAPRSKGDLRPARILGGRS
jgi:2-dehydro-3-deoxyphosphogluconate aldolase / (4S)-4-hydroxy-2-oxoglutarate aldolase